jgi:hypothetical protein
MVIAAVAVAATAAAVNRGGRAHAVDAGSTYAAPAVTAAFTARSYAPGTLAELAVRTTGPIRLQIFHAGAEERRSRSDDAIAGVPVSPSRPVLGGRTVRVRIGDWPSGLYFAELRSGSLTGYAPFVVRPQRLGAARIAVVLPTNTWQAYNFRDDNHDGTGDTWYASAAIHTVALDRPYLDRGVPPHFRSYDSGFVHWLAHGGPKVDMLADDDLEAVPNGAILARRYDLIVFSGHEEYVTPHVYDIVERYRNLGGNLMFLSANSFFYRVTRTGNVLHDRVRWRDRGRPEAALLGAQYVDWNHDRYPNRPFTVVGARQAPWLFSPAALRNGDTFGSYGIEVDARTGASPPGTRVLAEIHDIFGAGKSAEMTYYETAGGAKVFDAGVINFGGSALQPTVRPLISALFARLSRP